MVGTLRRRDLDMLFKNMKNKSACIGPGLWLGMYCVGIGKQIWGPISA
jgi:hypothetical protein